MIQLALSEKSTPPAVMFTSRLALPGAMTWTEKSTTCAANLPRSQKHTRARFLLLLIRCCCIIAVGCGAATTILLLPSVVFSRHLKRKNERKIRQKGKKKHELLWTGKGKKLKTYTRVVLVLVLVAGKTRNNEKKKKERDKKQKK